MTIATPREGARMRDNTTPEFDPTMRWDVIAAAEAAPEPAYAVYVRDTGARCMSTDDYDAAIARAVQVDGYVQETDSGTLVYAAPATDTAIDASFDAYR